MFFFFEIRCDLWIHVDVPFEVRFDEVLGQEASHSASKMQRLLESWGQDYCSSLDGRSQVWKEGLKLVFEGGHLLVDG